MRSINCRQAVILRNQCDPMTLPAICFPSQGKAGEEGGQLYALSYPVDLSTRLCIDIACCHRFYVAYVPSDEVLHVSPTQNGDSKQVLRVDDVMCLPADILENHKKAGSKFYK